jgi:Secretion system C-terminal sorting domain
MKKILSFYLFFVCLNLSFGQYYPLDNKRDYTWLTGYSGCNQFRFTSNSLTIDTIPIGSMGFNNAVICDTAGQLLLYTNGSTVRNKFGETLIDTLPIGDTNTDLGGTNYPFANLILPHPTIENKLFVLYQRYRNIYTVYNNCLNMQMDSLYENLIDMNGQQEHGQVVYKNKKISTRLSADSPQVNMDIYGLYACRHGNGRDWWVVTKAADTNTMLIFLLNKNGLALQKKQRIGQIIRGGIGQGCFTPDGKKFVKVGGNKCDSSFINVFDFDRCSGLFSNPKYYKRKLNINSFISGCAVSPNNRYLYIAQQKHILQYDLEASNIFGHSDTIVVNNRYPDISGDPTVLYNLSLAPNGKIYIMSSTTNTFLGVINQPNLVGTACNAVQQGLWVPVVHNYTFPNYPNFRLGPIDGSVCDSLGIDNLVTASPSPSRGGEYIRVSPNPTTGTLHLTHTEGTTLKYYTIADISGKIITQNTSISNDNELNLDLPNGVYFLIVNDINGQASRHKVVVLK